MKTKKTPVASKAAKMTAAQAIETLLSVADQFRGPRDRAARPELWRKLACETLRVAEEVNPALTVTIHMPQWCVDQWKKEAALAGVSVDQLMTVLVTGSWTEEHILCEGVANLLNDMLQEHEEKDDAPAREVTTKIAVHLCPETINKAMTALETREATLADVDRRLTALEAAGA